MWVFFFEASPPFLRAGSITWEGPPLPIGPQGVPHIAMVPIGPGIVGIYFSHPSSIFKGRDILYGECCVVMTRESPGSATLWNRFAGQVGSSPMIRRLARAFTTGSFPESRTRVATWDPQLLGWLAFYAFAVVHQASRTLCLRPRAPARLIATCVSQQSVSPQNSRRIDCGLSCAGRPSRLGALPMSGRRW